MKIASGASGSGACHARSRGPDPDPWFPEQGGLRDNPAEAIMIDLIEQHRDEVAALCRAAGVARIELFGSAARGQFDPANSDLDFLVEFDDLPPVTYARRFFELKEQLELLFDRPVDLVTRACLDNPYFRRRIESERRAVYAR